MEKTAQATLSAPITVQGKKTDILTLRRATLGDDEDAMDMAISFNRGNNPVTVELCTLSIVTGVPYDVLRTLDEDDIGAIRAAHNSLRPTKPKKKGGRNRDGYDARGRLHGLRLAMLSLAKFSGWSRTEIRNLTPEAFVGYADAAKDMDDNGA